MNDYELMVKISMSFLVVITLISAFCMNDCNSDFIKDKNKRKRFKKIITYSTISGLSAAILSLVILVHI